jgi:hypothetical protein
MASNPADGLTRNTAFLPLLTRSRGTIPFRVRLGLAKRVAVAPVAVWAPQVRSAASVVQSVGQMGRSRGRPNTLLDKLTTHCSIKERGT